MKHPHLFALVALLVASPARAAAFAPTISAGVGLPELAQVRVGAFVHPRLAIEAYTGLVLFSPLVGIGATGYLLGTARADGPPPHSLLLQGTFALNPRQRPISLQSGAESVGGGGLLYAGYALALRGGFLFHAKVGALIYEDDGLAGGPLVGVAAGWKF